MIQTMLERKVWYGVQICEGGSTPASGFETGVHIRQRILTGGPYPLADFELGPNSRGVQIRFGSGVTADLDPPWIWTANGYGPPLRRFGPPCQTFLLSILCIIFGSLFYLQAFLSIFFSITTRHFLNKGKKKKTLKMAFYKTTANGK